MKFLSCFLVLLSLLALGAPALWGQSPSDLDMLAVKSMQVRQVQGMFLADLEVILTNRGDQNIVLRDYKYTVTIVKLEPTETGVEEKFIELGQGEFRRLKMPKYHRSLKDGFVRELPGMVVGPVDMETNAKLIELFNLLGDPKAQFHMLLDLYEGEIGTELANGIQYQGGLRVELKFRPKVRREVLFD